MWKLSTSHEKGVKLDSSDGSNRLRFYEFVKIRKIFRVSRHDTMVGKILLLTLAYQICDELTDRFFEGSPCI